MPNARSTAILVCVAATLLVAPGCLVRRRIIARQTNASGSPRPLITATRDDLIRKLQEQYAAIHSFNATVDMTPALGSVYKGQITEYKDIRAYVLYRYPMTMRIIGLLPVVRSKAFDMVSQGDAFRIFIPSKNKFVEGRNDAPPASKNSIENLRPEAFVESMLVPPPDLAREPAHLLDATDEDNALYILYILEKDNSGEQTIARSIFFDRTTLYVVRQRHYDSQGNQLSDTRYRDWKTYNGISFPGTIDVNRPQDGYGVVMTIVKLDMNAEITDDKFVLDQPPGTQLQLIGTAKDAAPKGTSK